MVYKSFARLVQFLLGLSLTLACSTIAVSFADYVGASVTAPDELIVQGFTQFNQGNAAIALKLWRSASDSYRKAGNREGIVGSAINQSLALRSLGQFPQSCQVLAQDALQISNANVLCLNQLRSSGSSSLAINLSRIQPNSIQQLAAQHLGTALQFIGDFPNAKLVLQSIEKTASPERQGEIQLALGSVERAVFVQMRDLLSRSSDLETLGNGAIALKLQAETVLMRYEQAKTVHSSKVKAQINQFSFLVDLSQWLATQQNNQLPEIVALDRVVKDRLTQLTPIVVKTDFTTFSQIDQVYARLNVVNSLIEQAQIGASVDPAAAQLATEALSTARTLSNTRAISYSLGTLGRLAQQQNDLKLAQSRFTEALSLAQSVQASDAAYQWQQQLAEIAKQQGNPAQALKYYQSAINNLDRVRSDLLPIADDVQLSFREQVEPVYRGYMALLVDQPQPNLSPIIETYNRLKIAEVENFLQCGQLSLVPLSQQPQSSDEAIIYVLNLNQTIGVIVQSAPGSQRFYQADSATVQNAINGLTFNLQNAVQADRVVLPDEMVLKEYAQTLYNQLIAPANRDGLLTRKRIAFVLDNTLQGMPVGLLYDGKNYLSQRYSLRLSIGSELRPNEPNRSRNQKALIAALSEASPSFRDRRVEQSLLPLINVQSEIKAIRSSFPGSEILNKQFTLARLEDQIQRGSYNIIHIATHGQFSSVPDETFVVAWDQLITAPQLSVLLKSRTTAEIDLLVLSACQTAKGDIRSTLGLAGIGVQSGARSTVASLWLVDDAATALFVQNFYKKLAEGESKATALQQAQVSLQNSPYSNPYFWGAFVLVGAA